MYHAVLRQHARRARRSEHVHPVADDGWTYSEGRAPSEWGFGLEPSGLQVRWPGRLAAPAARVSAAECLQPLLPLMSRQALHLWNL